MADVDKAITFEDQVELGVRDRSKEMEIDFYSNLAEQLDSSDLSTIKNDLMTNVDSDKDSRSDWEKTYREGLEQLGMKYEERSQPFEGAKIRGI